MDADVRLAVTESRVADAVLELHGPERHAALGGGGWSCGACLTAYEDPEPFPCRTVAIVLMVLNVKVEDVFHLPSID
jgi:hypothetical protein